MAYRTQRALGVGTDPSAPLSFHVHTETAPDAGDPQAAAVRARARGGAGRRVGDGEGRGGTTLRPSVPLAPGSPLAVRQGRVEAGARFDDCPRFRSVSSTPCA